jgi:hypothetical protein
LRFIERKANGLREMVTIMHTDPGFGFGPVENRTKRSKQAILRAANNGRNGSLGVDSHGRRA